MGAALIKLTSCIPASALAEVAMHVKLQHCQNLNKGELGVKMDTLLLKVVKDHKSPYTNHIKADFVDAWLTEEMNMAEPDTFTNENLVKVLRSLVVAGTDTTSHTLRWALLFMIAHPEVQKKVQKELDEVVPNLQALSYQDCQNLPYTLATLMEVQRRVPVLPLSIAHSNFKETQLFGHLIPKRSIIIPNIYAVHHNAQVFPNPEQFLPERFLDDTTRKKNKDNLMPFSLGKRQCLGEDLALMELMLYFSSMLHCFYFLAPEGKTVSFESINSSVLVAKPFKLIVTPRYNKQVEKKS